jgi:nucleoside-diphosphate-sugar epimerase
MVNRVNQTSNMKTVLVTGCNGFIASYIVKELLEHGYCVHGTVRSIAQTVTYSHLLSLQGSINLTLFEADLMIPNSFDEAMENVQFVIHTACPFYLTTYDVINNTDGAYEKLVVPSLEGTRNVLASVAKFHDKIERFVFTSSTGALIGYGDREYDRTYNEQDWNVKSSLTNNPFAYSKTVAEKLVWEWWETIKAEHNSSIQVSTVLPVLVLGPFLNIERVKTLGIDHLNTSSRIMLNNLLKRKIDPENGHKVGTNGFSIVHVSDVARIHRLVMEAPQAAGQRFVAFSGKQQWITLNRIIADIYPRYKDTVPLVVESELTEQVGYDRMVRFTSKHLLETIPEFGEFISVEKTVTETMDYLINSGVADMLAATIEDKTT